MFESDEKNPSLVDRVIAQTFTRIASGEWPIGSRITEEQLAATVGISRTPVREAVRRMNEMGLIVTQPRCKLEIATVDERDLAEITRLREELESFALSLAMPRMRAEDISILEECQQACETLLHGGDHLATFRQDGVFHLTLATMSGNRYLAETLRRLEVKVLLCRMLHCRSHEKVQESVHFHRQIINAISAGDGTQAVELLRRHINDTGQV